MTHSNKKSRKIIFQDREFRWRARGDDGYISLRIWPKEPEGTAITASFSYHENWTPRKHRDGTTSYSSSGNQIVITNRIVRQVLEYAFARGYQCDLANSVFNLAAMDDNIDLQNAIRARDRNRES